MKTPVRIALICSFCSFLFSGWSQLHYDGPVSFTPLPFPSANTTTLKKPRVWLPGCAALTPKPGMSDFALYEASHPLPIDFTYPEALAPKPVVKMEARRCFGDVYYVQVFNPAVISPIQPTVPLRSEE